MEQNSVVGLADEDLKDLSLGLLREWWVKTTEALVDTAGSETALECLKPYFVHAGKAGAHVIRNVIAIEPVDVKSVVSLLCVPQACVCQYTTTYAFLGRNDNAFIEDNMCPTKGVCREVCLSRCDYCAKAMAEELNPEYSWELMTYQGKGDPKCRWECRSRRSDPIPFDGTEFKIKTQLPDDTTRFQLGLEYVGEMWVLSTRAFIDYSGPKTAIDRLIPYMRESGMSLGAKIKQTNEPKASDIRVLVDIVNKLNTTHRKEGSFERAGDKASGIITTCPFSDAPSEICLQYQAFFNGLLETIAPGFEFMYDRMMSRGDESCHWTIMKKGVKKIEPLKENERSEDPQRLLALRLAKGEISEEEFERKMDLMKKHGLVR